METTKNLLEELFAELDKKIADINRERRGEGLPLIAKAEVRLLGQMSLLSHTEVASVLTLAQTGDMDALLKMDHIVKEELKRGLTKRGLVYDEDSYQIWIPPGARYDDLFNYTNIIVKSLDPESALVSKAVKAPQKNLQLVREAILSEKFSNLVDRILASGGKLEDFA